MEQTIIEHPHIHPLYEGHPVRYMFMSAGSRIGVSSPPLGYLKLDLLTDEQQVWYAPMHTFCEEVVVVPKRGSEKEDAVWLLVTMFDGVSERSCVGVIDGENLTAGPICRMWLNHALPHSLHGCFTPFTPLLR
jgi:carotenoid cleavage dioxygenase-like enzyme